jgi:hypothetical protein
MLSNFDIDLLVKKMEIKNFRGCFYKDTLKEIKSNSSYILNLNSEYDEDGNRNKGSHWTALCIDDNKQAIYFDSFGLEPPKEVKNLLKSNQYKIGNTKKNIQSLMSNLCGFFCLAFIYFLNVSKFRTKNIIYDASIFIDLFEDLDLTHDVFKNEYVLSLFFTDKKSKELLFKNNNIGMNENNKIDNKFNIENKKIRK